MSDCDIPIVPRKAVYNAKKLIFTLEPVANLVKRASAGFDRSAGTGVYFRP
jgi:hypothetical protein